MTDKTDSKTQARRKYENTGRGKTIIKVNLTASDDATEWGKLKESLTENYGSVKAGILAMYRQQFEPSVVTPTLSARILTFLETHAHLNADFDPEYDDEDDKYGSPDAGNLFTIARQLRDSGKLPSSLKADSSWESGGYYPYTDKKARAEHDQLIAEIRAQGVE